MKREWTQQHSAIPRAFTALWRVKTTLTQLTLKNQLWRFCCEHKGLKSCGECTESGLNVRLSWFLGAWDLTLKWRHTDTLINQTNFDIRLHQLWRDTLSFLIYYYYFCFGEDTFKFIYLFFVLEKWNLNCHSAFVYAENKLFCFSFVPIPCLFSNLNRVVKYKSYRVTQSSAELSNRRKKVGSWLSLNGSWLFWFTAKQQLLETHLLSMTHHLRLWEIHPVVSSHHVFN